MMRNRKIQLILFLLILLVGLLYFSGFFDFTLWGDDWQILFGALHDQTRSLDTLLRMQLFWPYGGQSLFMLITYKLFGPNSFYFFTASFIFRIIAAYSIFKLTEQLSRNKLTGYLAALLFLTSFAGIDSTNWVENSINYLSLAAVCWGFYFLIWKKYPLVYLMFALALISAPVRVHGLLLLYPLVETILTLADKKRWKIALFNMIIFSAIFYLFKILNIYGAVGSEIVGRIGYTALPFLQQDPSNIYKVFIYPLGSFFNSFLPAEDLFNGSWLRVELGYVQLGLIFLVPTMINLRILYKYRIGLIVSFLISLVWVFYLALIKLGFSKELRVDGLSVLFGGGLVYLFVTAILYLWLANRKRESMFMLMLLAWPISFILTPHLLQNPGNTIEHHSRYLTVSAAGSWMLLSYSLYILMSSFKVTRKGYLYITAFSLLCLLLFNFIHTQRYFQIARQYRSNSITMPMWQTIYKEMEKYPYDGRVRLVVFIYSDPGSFQSQVGFGGHFRYAVVNGIYDTHQKPWILANDDLATLKKAFSDPSIGHQYWGPKIDDYLMVKDIIGFRVVPGKIIPDTENIRSALLKI